MTACTATQSAPIGPVRSSVPTYVTRPGPCGVEYTDECRSGTPDIPLPQQPPTYAAPPYHSLLHRAKPGGAILPRDRRAAAPDVAHLGHRALARARRGAHGALALEGVEDLRHRTPPSASRCQTKIGVCARQVRTYRDQRRVGFHGCRARMRGDGRGTLALERKRYATGTTTHLR